MRMMGSADIKGRFPELDRQDEQKADKKSGQIADGGNRRLGDLTDGKTSRGNVEADGGQKHHGLIGHHLHQLSLRSHGAVRRVRGAGRHDEKDSRQGQRKEHKQNISAPEKQRACKHHEYQKAADQKVLYAVYHNGLFAEQLMNVIERLKQRRPLPALHAGRHLPVQPFQQSAGERRPDQIYNCNDKGSHTATPPIVRISRIISAPAAKTMEGISTLFSLK